MDDAMLKNITEGIENGRNQLLWDAEVQEAKTLKNKYSIINAYNIASGLIEGLDYLKNMQGSSFDYKIKESGDHLILSTNICIEEKIGRPFKNSTPLNVTVYNPSDVTVATKPVIKALWGKKNVIINSEEEDRIDFMVERTINLIARKAVEKKLIP